MNAAIPTTIPTPSLSEVAGTIRSTLQKFTPEAIAAQLHDLAFEVSPQRIWRCFLGRKHVMLTTWLYLGLDEVDFGGGRTRFVWLIMPPLDGLVDVLETVGERSEGGHWSKNGVDVSVYLEEKAMERLLKDKELWGGV
jgi:hypothetical protein